MGQLDKHGRVDTLLIINNLAVMCQNKLKVKIGVRLNPFTGVEHEIYEYVPCRKCEECISIRKSQWCFRALVETEHCYNADFVTLTYNPEYLPADKSVNVSHCQKFFKRVRSQIKRWYPSFDVKRYPLRYFLVSEYGGQFGRPHYHLILWNCPLNFIELQKCWRNGFIKIGDTTPKSVQYCLKYFAIKEKAPLGRRFNFCLMSKNIGKQWLSDNLHYVKSYVRMPGLGYKIPIPSYYRSKLGYPKREYFHDYEPDLMEYFSPKFLRSRGLSRRTDFNRYINQSRNNLNDLYEDAENYYLYRDACFHAKYDKCNLKDNQ